MDLRAVARASVAQALTQPPGLKALLLDDDTLPMLSVLYSQSELLAHEVVYIDKLSNASQLPVDSLAHVTVIALVRPTAANVHALRYALRAAPFRSLRLFFSNAVRRTLLEEAAYSDAHDVVSSVRELFVDFTVHAPFHLSSRGADRLPDAVAAALLALRLRAPSVRAQARSVAAAEFAHRLAERIDRERELFEQHPPKHQYDNDHENDAPLVLVLDRREDPVTPLLAQWTYEAMVHEVLGISDGRVAVPASTTAPEVVLDAADDDFYAAHRYANFGDLGAALHARVAAFQADSKSTAPPPGGFPSIEAMTEFINRYPDTRRRSAALARHVAVTAELSSRVSAGQLLRVSELEQDIACRESEAEHRRAVFLVLSEPHPGGVALSDRLKLVILYSLRYEAFLYGSGTATSASASSSASAPSAKANGITNNSAILQQMINKLRSTGVDDAGIQLIASVRAYAGNARRASDLFHNRSFLAVASASMRRGILRGVDNVYTQHEPLLAHTLDALFRSKARCMDFPLIHPPAPDTADFVRPTRTVVVVMVGGSTYEEAKCVSAVNAGPHAFAPPAGSATASAAAAAKLVGKGGAHVLLVAPHILNSTSFAVEIARAASAQQQRQRAQQQLVRSPR